MISRLLGWMLLCCSLSACATVASAPSIRADMQTPIRSAKVEVRGGEPVFVINGEPTYFACHYLRNYRPSLREKWADGVRDSVSRFAKRGIHRFEAQVDLGWRSTDTFEPTGTGMDVTADAVMSAILEADPAAQVIFRIGAHNLLPGHLPADFTKDHADEFEQDDKGNRYSISFGSDLGFEKLSAALKRLVRYTESRPWAGHVVGYTIFLEFEGVPWGSVTEGAFTDYSPAMLATWRQFLKARYASDAALREAWGDANVMLASAALPTPAEHLGGDARFMFHDPIKGRKTRDYYELMDELTIRRHQQTARAVKEACEHRKLVGMMGGYSQDAGEPRSIMSPTGFPEVMLHKQHFSGPGCWSRAFEIPEIDYFFAPRDYLNTGVNGVCIPLHMPASLRLHGKVTWLEDDQRTHLHGAAQFNPGLQNANESVMAHLRNAGLLYTETGATDWMEQVSNWLMDDAILDNLGRVSRVLDESVKPQQNFDAVPDAICVLFDEESQGRTKPVTLLDEELFWHQRNEGLAHCGVPVRFHLLSDLARPNFPKYKCFILPNAYHWTPEKEALLSKVKRDGNVILWIYGAGYVGERALSGEGMQAATGMKIVPDPGAWVHRISITDFTHPITRALDNDLIFGSTRHFGPTFRVDDPHARILGRSFAIGMNRQPALAIREFGRGARGNSDAGIRGPGDYASLYCEAPNLPSSLLREIARYAGSHVFLDTNDFLLAGKDLIMIHGAKPGTRLLHLPRRADVIDVMTGKTLASNAKKIRVTLDAGTLLLKLK